MRKKILIAGLLLAVGILGCGCSKSKDNTAAIKKSGVLRVAIQDGSSGLTRKTASGDYEGLEAELATQIAAGFSVTPKFVEVPAGTNPVTLLDDGSADMAIGSICDTEELKRNYAVSDSYAKSHIFVVTKRGNFSNMAVDFADKQVGLAPGLDGSEVMARTSIPSDHRKTYDTIEEAAAALKDETIFGFICNDDEAFTLAEDTGLQAQDLIMNSQDDYVMVTVKSNSKLLEGMDAIMNYYLQQTSSNE